MRLSLLPNVLLSRSSVCLGCRTLFSLNRIDIRKSHQFTKSRSIKYLEKCKVAEEQWQERAAKISQGELQNPWDLLEERGYVKDVTGCVSTYPL